jgi:hypothetical protein
MTDFLTWLRSLGLDRYAQVFADNDVDLDALRLLSEKDLQELGVSLGHRKKLLKAVAELVNRPTGTEGEEGKGEKDKEGEEHLEPSVRSQESRGQGQTPTAQTLDSRLSDSRLTAERRQLTVMFGFVAEIVTETACGYS